ncbi:hypothetical protein [Mangrovimonas cancribranchiae]|uniref:Mobilization protein n=1 Tax=Mangrovimonas cancribranchiae TaxID=3080055 RepID=A0AAU6NY93_9FLAO
MDIELLHIKCKESTRKAFNEYKRQVDVRLFPFDKGLHENLKAQMFQDIGMSVTKYFVNNYSLSLEQLKYLDNTLNEYKMLAGKTADNYSKRHFNI